MNFMRVCTIVTRQWRNGASVTLSSSEREIRLLCVDQHVCHHRGVRVRVPNRELRHGPARDMGEFIGSPTFIAFDDAKWSVRVYPRGDQHDAIEHVSCLLHREEEDRGPEEVLHERGYVEDDAVMLTCSIQKSKGVNITLIFNSVECWTDLIDSDSKPT
ncbi:hypothetical protein JTE90_023889 [Oedothorax gibbosus]|uniref:Uncharacterized protein n=1 Tax=Oedothorax gibbosus TaxID=931172 RepID=A0AAV6UNU7_9ARAC|nr:hypothetical protein JTE90_023889 [Oedothorax gibbosus]